MAGFAKRDREMSAQVEPRNFSWFVDKKIAGMAWPSAESFPFLAENGISVLINLTETNPPAYHSIATSHNIRCIHCNIKAYGTPSLEQVRINCLVQSLPSFIALLSTCRISDYLSNDVLRDCRLKRY